MNLTTIFMLINTMFIILVMIKLSEDFGYVKSMLKELLDQKEKEPVDKKEKQPYSDLSARMASLTEQERLLIEKMENECIE